MFNGKQWTKSEERSLQ